MCWSEGASVAMVGLGAVATVVTARRREPWAIPATLAFFTVMEALQAVGYLVIDECSLAPNKAVTVLSYVHIALQPIFINAFALAVVAPAASARTRRIVLGLAGLGSLFMLLYLVPVGWAGQCPAGASLCGPEWCTRTGTWHLAWTMPLNDYWGALVGPAVADIIQFPSYLLAVFVLPLAYGAWRFAAFHALLGPILASFLTDNPNEMPAVWCLFSVGLVLIALSPLIRRHMAPAAAA